MEPHENNLNPVSGEPGGEEDGGDGCVEMVPKDDFEELANKYEELKVQVEHHFDIEHAQEKRDVPTIKAPSKPTREQWEQHQATHTICTMV